MFQNLESKYRNTQQLTTNMSCQSSHRKAEKQIQKVKACASVSFMDDLNANEGCDMSNSISFSRMSVRSALRLCWHLSPWIEVRPWKEGEKMAISLGHALHQLMEELWYECIFYFVIQIFLNIYIYIYIYIYIDRTKLPQ